MLAWLKGLGIVGKLIAAAVAVAILVGGFMAVQKFFTGGLKTEVKLNKNLGKAGIESGRDAVDTVSNRAAAEQEILGAAQEAKDEISNQVDATSVTRVGRSSLCQRSPNRRGCGGVQRASPE